VLATGLEVYGSGKNTLMAQEADFYTAEEVAKVLGVPVSRVFGMLCGGELEGHQDEWARWLVPASALQGARRNSEPSNREGLPEQNAGSRAAMEEKTRVQDANETTVLSEGRPFLEPAVDISSLVDEETTQETDEAPVGGSRTSPQSIDVDAAETLPLDGLSKAASSIGAADETVKEITEQLAAAAAKTRELRGRLELAEATEAALRERLERERREIDGDSTQAEQDVVVAERLEKEPAGGRGDGFWRSLFGG
jgi:hypothetical protein